MLRFRIMIKIIFTKFILINYYKDLFDINKYLKNNHKYWRYQIVWNILDSHLFNRENLENEFVELIININIQLQKFQKECLLYE